MQRQGLYDPNNEHDACGMGFVVNLGGQKSHEIVRKGIEILVPREFFARECPARGFSLPEPGAYGVGMMFLPVEPQQRLICEGIIERIAREEGLAVLGWRDTPVRGDAIGRQARGTQPYIEQVFLHHGAAMTQDQLERKLYVVRRRAEAEVAASGIRERSF